MATTLNAALIISGRTSNTATAPDSGTLENNLANGTDGQRWTNGIASGMVDRQYLADKTLGAAATDSFNLLAAGSLTDVYGQAIDADELKGLIIKCLTGEITFEAPVANFLDCFKATGDGIKLSAGQTQAIDFGAAGLTVSTNGKFDIDDSGAAGSTYSIWLVVAQ